MTADDDLQAAIAEAQKMATAELKLSALERLRKSVLSERRILRALTIVAIIVGMGGIGLSIWAVDRVLEAEASRADARIVSCNSYNTDTVDKVNGILFTLAARSSDPDEATKRIEPLLLARRDCSDRGITEYFDGDDATDPFIPVTVP